MLSLSRVMPSLTRAARSVAAAGVQGAVAPVAARTMGTATDSAATKKRRRKKKATAAPAAGADDDYLVIDESFTAKQGAAFDELLPSGVPALAAQFLQSVNVTPDAAGSMDTEKLMVALADQRAKVEEVIAQMGTPVPFEVEDFVVLALSIADFSAANTAKLADDLEAFLDAVQASPEHIQTKFTDKSLPQEEVAIATDILLIEEEPTYAELQEGLSSDVLSRAVGPEDSFAEWKTARADVAEALALKSTRWLVGEVCARDPSLLPVIAETLRNVSNKQRKAVEVTVSSAVALSAAQEKEVMAAIEARASEEFAGEGYDEFHVDFEVQEDLSGGLFVEFNAGSRQAVIDLTAAKFLTAARQMDA